jgi:hypothetical protein
VARRRHVGVGNHVLEVPPAVRPDGRAGGRDAAESPAKGVPTHTRGPAGADGTAWLPYLLVAPVASFAPDFRSNLCCISFQKYVKYPL